MLPSSVMGCSHRVVHVFASGELDRLRTLPSELGGNIWHSCFSFWKVKGFMKLDHLLASCLSGLVVSSTSHRLTHYLEPWWPCDEFHSVVCPACWHAYSPLFHFRAGCFYTFFGVKFAMIGPAGDQSAGCFLGRTKARAFGSSRSAARHTS